MSCGPSDQGGKNQKKQGEIAKKIRGPQQSKQGKRKESKKEGKEPQRAVKR